MSETESSHWLVKSVQSRYPERNFPLGVELSENLSEAWCQMASLFQITQGEVAACVAQAFGLQVGSISEFQPTDLSVLPEHLCRAMKLVQLWANEQSVCFAVADPRLSAEQNNHLRVAAARQVELVIMPPDDIDTCMTRMFAKSAEGGFDRAYAIDLQATELPADNAPVVKLACALLRKAIDSDASDIHIHPFVGGGAIRFRIDGRLRRIATIPNESLAGLSRYFKAHARLEPSPLKPQDGRLRLIYGRREIDVRLSILPAYDGERIVCRLLDQSRNFSLQQSHFSIVDQQVLRRMTGNSAGIVLLTGPTGSGKTSTLYALLTELNTVDVNIMTIEDPVEYVLPGISQIQVSEKQGLSFADTLRSILRQDPDILLIGEIRDGETARIATQAALTGHLVLSTLHTNDALGALPRLLDLGLDTSILADALLGVISQRLVRRLCESCRQPTQAPYLPGEAEFQRLTGESPAYRPGACQVCGHTGYRGRLPVIESLEISPPLREAIASGERRLGELARIASGYRRSMATSAKEWIVSGQTTPAEVQQVLGMGFWRELAEEHGIRPESLSANLDQEGKPGERLKILLLSQDQTLADILAENLNYMVERVDSDELAEAYLNQHNDVIGLVFDTQLAEKPFERWLICLRTKLAWAGLPGLFITRPEDVELKVILDGFGAPNVERGDPQASGGLSDAVTLLLQGKR